MPSKRRRIPQSRRAPAAERDAVLAAFIAADVPAIREALGLPVWDNTPLHTSEDGHCEYCGRSIDEPPGTGIAGCQNNHAMMGQLRRRLIATVEARAGIAWDDLDAEDDAVAAAAWDKLAPLAEAVGVTEAQWARVLARAGWGDDEEEASDGAD